MTVMDMRALLTAHLTPPVAASIGLLALLAIALLASVLRTPRHVSSDQVAAVSNASVTWRRRAVLNKGERAVFHATNAVIRDLGRHWQVWPQVSLGEVLVTVGRTEADREAHRWINSKRCDFIVVDAAGLPLAAIEYQGSGHDQGNAAERDAVKRIALTKAGIEYVEVPAHLAYREGHLRAHLAERLRPLAYEMASPWEPAYGQA